MVEPLTTPERLVAAVPDSLPIDDALTALADPERRRLIGILGQLDTPERMSALTRTLAVEMDWTGGDAVEQLHVRLHHVHVPKLADVGIVIYDDEADSVELTERGRPLADAMSV